MDRGNAVPVHEGEELDVLIEAVGEKGDGIAKVKGFVLFVANTKAGDEVRVKITKVLKNVGFAEMIGKAEKPVAKDEPKLARPKKPEQAIQVDEETGKEKIKGESLEAEYDPSKDSEDFGEE